MRELVSATQAAWSTPGGDGAVGASSAPEVRENALRRAVVRTLVYADLFEYPLSPAEIRRYLVGEPASTRQVAAMLDGDAVLRPHIEQTGGWVFLAGRSHLTEIRKERAAISARLWPIARAYGKGIAQLPFVRLVAVTGALAMDNASLDDDIDLFVLVQPGRLWLGRLLILAVVKLAARRGIELCPNFLMSTDHLRVSERNLFTAHEVSQMVPLMRTPWYEAFVDANGWVRNILPNAFSDESRPAADRTLRSDGSAVGRMLSSTVFDPIERWEMQRKVRRLTARHEREGGNVAFSAHECRGHFAAHDARILSAYHERLSAYAHVLP